MKITHRIYEDGSRVRCEQLALEAACQSMLDRPWPPSSPCHVPWYTGAGKTAACTLAQLRRWKVIHNPNGTIIGVDRDRPKATRITTGAAVGARQHQLYSVNTWVFINMQNTVRQYQ